MLVGIFKKYLWKFQVKRTCFEWVNVTKLGWLFQLFSVVKLQYALKCKLRAYLRKLEYIKIHLYSAFCECFIVYNCIKMRLFRVFALLKCISFPEKTVGVKINRSICYIFKFFNDFRFFLVKIFVFFCFFF